LFIHLNAGEISMKRVLFRSGFCVAVVVSAYVLGCTEPSDVRIGRSAPRTTGKPGPEESFELILETFRRGVEGAKIGFVARREGGRSMMSGENKVSHELIRPDKEGGPYKAIITVRSQSSYSLQRTTAPEETSKENSDNRSSQSDIAGTDDPTGMDILDSDLVSAPPTGGSNRLASQPEGTTTVARVPPTSVKKSYELLYENGRWNLVTKLDPETERGIENAFKHALNTQI
jgi:hypothetical protein